MAIVEVQDNVLHVRGPDAIDGTPVLDIKLCFPEFDGSRGPRLMEDYF